MKVNLKKGKKLKSYNVVDSLDEVTLEKWTELIKLKESSNSEEALKTIELLSDIPQLLISELALHDVVSLLGHIAEIQSKVEGKFRDTIIIDKKKYGFHPNLEKITLGEWADIEACLKLGLEENMHRVMAVLYRPILEQKGKRYSIESYDHNTTEVRAERFKQMKASDVNNSLLFFWSLGQELSRSLPLYLMERVKQLTKDRLTNKTNSQKNGTGSE